MNDAVKKLSNETLPLRIFFSKTNRAKYISHLDLNRTMQRTVKRTKLPVWETEGFNPHIYITFALPLSLGIESVCEAMDIKLIKEIDCNEIQERMNFALPCDLRVLSVSKPVFKHTEIKKAEYEISNDIKNNGFLDFINQEQILVDKRTKKKGVSEINLKPFIEYSFKENKLTLILPAGTELNINPYLVFDAYEKFVGKKTEYSRILRTNVYTENGEVFA